MSDALEYLVESAVRPRFSESAWARGETYLAHDAVSGRSWHRQGSSIVIEADVRRSAARAYHVTITYDADGRCAWDCTCPFGSAVCEHHAAVLQAWFTQAATFESKDGEALPATVVERLDRPEPAVEVPVSADASARKEPAAAREGSRATPAGPGPGPAARTLLSFEGDMTVRVNIDLASPLLLELLESLGTVVRRNPTGRTYRLTAQGLQATVGGGRSLDELVVALAEAGQQPVPPAVSGQWQAWMAAAGNFHLYDELSVIEFADDYTLQELLRGSGLRRYLLHIFSPRLVAVYPGRLDALVADLEQRGFMPRVE